MMQGVGNGRIPVIYVLSNGRSGSTLLDLLLGTHPEIWTLGEAQILPWELRLNRTPCGCGKPVGECDFWRSALPGIPFDQGDYPIEHFRERHNAGRVLRWPLLLDILLRRCSQRWQPAVDEYGRLNSQYFEAVWRCSQERTGRPVRWLVDASKDVYRFVWLWQSGRFDFRVVQLVKDPRAFVYSMVKDNPDALRRVARFSGRWLVENTIYSHVCGTRSLVDYTFRLKYEDLASHPSRVLAQLGAWLGLDFSGVPFDTFRAQENHAISGNPMRWRNTAIQLDDRWRRALPPSSARLAWGISGILARSYGYRREGAWRSW